MQGETQPRQTESSSRVAGEECNSLRRKSYKNQRRETKGATLSTQSAAFSTKARYKVVSMKLNGEWKLKAAKRLLKGLCHNGSVSALPSFCTDGAHIYMLLCVDGWTIIFAFSVTLYIY